MQNVERLSITLPAEMVQRIRRKVEQGGYASNSEVIREAVRAFEAQAQLHEERLTSIRSRIAEADADPRPSLSEDEVDRHFAARRQRSAKPRGDHA